MEKLEKARKYEKAHGRQIRPEERPVFHLTPYVGWLNDPNGFSFYKGEYHLFYQYHPYGTHWGPMHWGHCKSRDLLRWEHLPAALAPDAPSDAGGCFSGSALTLPTGEHLLLYTGVREQGGLSEQVQCVALGDGVDYQKYEGNPVITADMLPAGGSRADFRDPKVWFEAGKYHAVVGNRTEDGSGAILLFESEDAFHWRYVDMLDRSANRYGRMWECPDFFPLEGTRLLTTSPQEMRAEGREFHNGSGAVSITGTYDETGFHRKEIHALDYGLDFYAPQTMLTPDGRRVLVAWMQSPENSVHQPQGAKWFGMMTVPRELSLRGGRLVQRPVRELLARRTDPVLIRSASVGERVRFPGVRGRVLDLTVRVHPGAYSRFEMRIAEGGQLYTSVVYRPREGLLIFDRSHSGFFCDILHTREAEVSTQDGSLELRLILDRFSVEIFVNDGEKVLSSTLHTPPEADGISFAAEGTALVDVEKYSIRF